MSDVAVSVLVVLAFLVLAALSWRAVFCNVHRLRVARSSPPLHGLDLSAATVAPVPDARNWPRVADITDPAVAAAYASLADDRYVTGALVGEVLVVAGGAALGAVLIDSIGGDWGDITKSVAAVGVTTFGITYRIRATRFWEVRAARYEAHSRTLIAQRAATVVPPRSLLDRVLGRLSRSRGTR